MRNLDSCWCLRCTLCPFKVRNKFLVNFWNRTILLYIPCMYVCMCVYVCIYIYIYIYIYTYTHYLLYKIEKFWEMHLNITVVKAFHLLELRALFWIGYFKTKGMMSPYLEDEGVVERVGIKVYFMAESWVKFAFRRKEVGWGRWRGYNS